MNDKITDLLTDYYESFSDSIVEFELHLKVSEGEVKSRCLRLLLKPEHDEAQVLVQYSPSVPRMLEEQAVMHAGQYGGFVGITRNGQVTFAATYQHHSKPRVHRFGN